MIRTQIQLTEEQHRHLRRLAAERGVSLAELIRRSVDGLLASETVNRDALYEKASRLIGRFEDAEAATDIAQEHDRYLDEIYG